MLIKTSIIVAMAENGCIGKDNKMPWHISDDMKRFKSLTMGHPVIMGRRTFESVLGYLGKPLPGRDNLVVSSSGYKSEHNVPVLGNMSSTINYAKRIALENNLDEIFIIGGAQVYHQNINYADRIHLTKIHKVVEGDAFFPELDEEDWTETYREDHLDHEPPYSFITLERQQ